MSCFFTTSSVFFASVTSKYSKGPDCIISSEDFIMSEAITLLLPYTSLSLTTNSEPICPEDPITNILSVKIFFLQI